MIQSIKEFFKGKSVLVTGATGFMGKILVEKLLRSCPDIECIYIIIRNRKGKSTKERLHQMLDIPIFDKLREERPSDLESKLVALEGDMMEARLGLSAEDYTMLGERISIIFHVAASIRFNDPLAYATRLNTKGTKEVVDLAYTMPNLVALLHVSTTYCNCDRQEVAEIVYPPHADWTKTLNIVEKTDPAIMNILSQKYIGRMPNTYTFSKSMAEHVIWDQRERLPVIIFRPSIVISSWREPVPGWVDNVNGPMGVLIGYGKGVIRTTLTDTSVVPDYMTVDLATRAIIIAAWRRAHLKSSDDYTKHIYNGSSVQKSIPIHEMVDISIKQLNETPLYETMWHYSKHTTKSKTWFTINVWLKHVIPAIIIDLFLRLTGREPILLAIQKKVYVAMMALGYFTTKAWIFHNSNFLSLNSELLPEDVEDFDFNFQSIDPDEFFKIAMHGARKYLLRESDDLIPAARIRARRLLWADRILKGLLWTLLIWILISYEIPQRIILNLKAIMLSIVSYLT